MKNESGNELTIEETFEKIEELMEKMQDDKITLEESLNLYKKGTEMLKSCSDKIEHVEQQLQIISKEEVM